MATRSPRHGRAVRACEEVARGGHVTVQVAQASAMAAARAEGAIPVRLARRPLLALRTTASGTTLVYEFTILRVDMAVGGLAEGPKWLVRVDAATGAVTRIRHE